MKAVLVGIVLLALAAGPTACSVRRARQLEGRVAALDAQVTRLQDQLQEVRDTLDDTKTELDTLNVAVDDLTSAVADFGSRDSESVAADVEAAADAVESATESVETSLDDAISVAEGEVDEDVPASKVKSKRGADRRPELTRLDVSRRAPRPVDGRSRERSPHSVS